MNDILSHVEYLPTELKYNIGEYMRQILIFERLRSIYDVKRKFSTLRKERKDYLGVDPLPETMKFSWSIDYIKLKEIFFEELKRLENLNDEKWVSLCKFLISGHEWINGSLYDFIKSVEFVSIKLNPYGFTYYWPLAFVPKKIFEKNIKCKIVLTIGTIFRPQTEVRVLETFNGGLMDISSFLRRYVNRDIIKIHISAINHETLRIKTYYRYYD